MKRFIPGLRIIKTGVAVFLCFLFFSMFNQHRPVHAVLACILTMRVTSEETVIVGLQRVKGTFLGGIISIFALLTIESLNIPDDSLYYSLMISLAIVVSFMFCKGFEMEPYVATMSGVVLVITLISHSDSHLNVFTYVGGRIIETLIGITIAFLVNRFLNFKKLMP